MKPPLGAPEMAQEADRSPINGSDAQKQHDDEYDLEAHAQPPLIKNGPAGGRCMRHGDNQQEAGARWGTVPAASFWSGMPSLCSAVA